jgi:hypothetical protein
MQNSKGTVNGWNEDLKEMRRVFRYKSGKILKPNELNMDKTYRKMRDRRPSP